MLILTNDLVVGIPMVDAQHKELFDRINSVEYSTSREEVGAMLQRLGDYIVKHFTAEEALQKQAGYYNCDGHKAQHALYLAEFNRLKDLYEGGDSQFSLELIITWLVQHIKTADVDFGQFYKTQKR